MNTRTYTDRVNRIHILCDEDVFGCSDRYTIRFEGHEDEVVAEPGDTPERTWALVLRSITNLRWAIQVGGWPGNPQEFATVYADISPTEEQERKHQRDHLSSCLYRIGHDPKTPSMARVKALAALCELHGLTDPCPENQLELIRAEKARRAQLQTLQNAGSLK